MKTSHTLHLFSNIYPNGDGEPFLENELFYLAPKFEKVIIYPANGTNAIKKIPLNAEVVNLQSESIKFSTLNIVVGNLFLVFGMHWKEVMKSKSKLIYFKHFREFNSRLCKSICLANSIKTTLKTTPGKNDIFYSFWMNETATALSVLKYKDQIKRYVFRVNGFDLYENQTKWNYIPFRPFNFANASKVFVVSNTGTKYLKSFNIYPEKIECSYFGTKDYGMSKFDSAGKFCIFTCSNLNSLKRADALVDILKNISIPIKWIHHGNMGDSEKTFFEKIKELTSNVEFELHERKENYEEVMQFMKKTSINLFVLLSRTEGLPVTLIEASSFGIPIIATNVGGVSEVVTEKNGILVEKDFDPKKIASIISNFMNSNKNTIEFRKQVRLFWEGKFNGTNNYSIFYNKLISC